MNNDLTIDNFNLIEDKNPYSKSTDYTIIQIADKKYAIESKKVFEIIKLPQLDDSNTMPNCILGFVEYKMSPVAVIDLREIFKLERIVYDINSEIIIIESEDIVTSIICDKVFDVCKLKNEKIHELPYQMENGFFEGMYVNDENENIYILSVENIVKYIKENSKNFQISTQKYICQDEESKDILKERRTFLKKIEQNVQIETPLYDMGVSFSIDGLKYYINMASVKEFFKPQNEKITKVPSTPDFIVGLINIKGEYITILDIRKFYGEHKTTIKEKSTIIILNSEEFKIGILADEILENMNINFNELIQNKLQKQEDYKMFEFVKDDEIYQVLDIDNLLSDDRLAIC